MSKNEEKKLLHFTSVGELNKISEDVKVNINTAFQCKQYCKAANDIFRKAENFFREKDEEQSYMLFMRYFYIVQCIKKNYEFVKSKNSYLPILKESNVESAITKAEELSKSLHSRYKIRDAALVEQNELEKKKNLKKANLKRTVENGEGSNSAKKKIGDGLDLPDVPNDNSHTNDNAQPDNKSNTNVNETDPVVSADLFQTKGFISVTELYSLFKECKDKLDSILLIDIRPCDEYNASRITHKCIINVPDQLLQFGANINSVERKLSKESWEVWSSRFQKETIVLMDSELIDTNTVSVALILLQDILCKFEAKYKVFILIGGFKRWLLHYPSMATDPFYSKKPILTVTEYDPTSFLKNFSYPELPSIEKKKNEEIVPPSVLASTDFSLQKNNVEADGMPSINRGNKPSLTNTSSPVVPGMKNVGSLTSNLNNNMAGAINSLSSLTTDFMPPSLSNTNLINDNSRQVPNIGNQIISQTMEQQNFILRNNDNNVNINNIGSTTPKIPFIQNITSNSSFSNVNSTFSSSGSTTNISTSVSPNILPTAYTPPNIPTAHPSNIIHSSNASTIPQSIQPNVQPSTIPSYPQNIQANVQLPKPSKILPNIQANVQPPITSNMPQNIQANVQPPIISNIPHNIQANVQPPITSNIPQNIQANVQPQISSNVLQNIQANVQQPITSNMPQNILANAQPPITSIMPQNIQANVQPPITSNIPQNIQTNIHPPISSNIPQNIQANVQPPITSNMPQNIQANVQPPVSSNIVQNIQANVSTIPQGNQPYIQPPNVSNVPQGSQPILQNKTNNLSSGSSNLSSAYRPIVNTSSSNPKQPNTYMPGTLPVNTSPNNSLPNISAPVAVPMPNITIANTPSTLTQQPKGVLQNNQPQISNTNRTFTTTFGLPTGWEKAVSHETGRIYYKDHNTQTTHWTLPSEILAQINKKEGQRVDNNKSKVTSLTDSKPALKRSLSTPNIADLIIEDDAGNVRKETAVHPKPVIDRGVKPKEQRQVLVDRSKKPISASRLQKLSPIYGSIGHGLTGLKNLGNTCYMNSVIQCLSNTMPLRQYFTSGLYEQDLNVKNMNSCPGEIARELSFVVIVLSAGQYRSVSPVDFKSALGRFSSQFNGSQQQDSHELLMFLLDGLHEDINKVKMRQVIKERNNENQPDHVCADQAWDDYLLNNNSIIVNLFQGQFRSTVVCLTCGHKSKTYDAFNCLQLELPSNKNATLQDCISLFTKAEKMGGNDSWKCSKCKCYREASKTIEVWKLPPVLIIQLKRFRCDGRWRNKIQSGINFPLKNLNISNHVVGPKSHFSNYHLYGVINHYGSFESGHYTSYCENANNRRWHSFDDNIVKEMDAGSIKTNAAYLLFYTAVDFRDSS